MRLIQITDLHISVEDDFPYTIDVRKNFLKVLRAAKALQPDHIILTGDLCFDDGDESIYLWIKKHIDRTKIPYSVISGNHDNSDILAKAFGVEQFLTDGELYYAKKIGKKICLFLDSSRGFHSIVQQKWLKRQMQSAKEDIVVFMHHPPFKVGVPFMDNKHALQDMKAIQKIMHNYDHNVTVFCGHYHVDKTIHSKNVMLQITPSCFFQIDQNAPEFKVDHHQIAFREIKFENQYVSTTLKYFTGYKKT